MQGIKYNAYCFLTTLQIRLQSLKIFVKQFIFCCSNVNVSGMQVKMQDFSKRKYFTQNPFLNRIPFHAQDFNSKYIIAIEKLQSLFLTRQLIDITYLICVQI